MQPEVHKKAYSAIKRTILDWAIKSMEVEEAQRTVGHLASRGIAELLTAYLHRIGLLSSGGSVNHRWFRSVNSASLHIPPFPEKKNILPDIMKLEIECDKLAYGKPINSEKLKEVVELFRKLGEELERLEGDKNGKKE